LTGVQKGIAPRKDAAPGVDCFKGGIDAEPEIYT